MKILHVTRTLNPAWGGPVEGVKNIAGQAAIRGHHLEVTCLDDTNSPWLKNSDLHVNAVGPALYGNFGYSRRLDSWLAANTRRFDVIVVNGIWMYFSTAVRHAAMKSKVPYFVFTHGALDPWFRHRYPYKQVKKAVYWMLFEHKVMRDAAAVLFTTSEERELSRGAFWPYRCTEEVVGYGIADPALRCNGSKDVPNSTQELSHFLPALAGRKFLLFLARIHEKKGIDLLLQAVANSRQHFKEHAFVIAGSGQESYVTKLKSLASRLGLDRSVIWAGPLYGETKWAAIRNAETYILPSHQENFGISVVEALAWGVPVLITNNVNIWREVSFENAGFVESDDVAGTTRLLRRWATLEREQAASMRENARRCFCKWFDAVDTTTNLFTLLGEHAA